jgi:hypothetical protein
MESESASPPALSGHYEDSSVWMVFSIAVNTMTSAGRLYSTVARSVTLPRVHLNHSLGTATRRRPHPFVNPGRRKKEEGRRKKKAASFFIFHPSSFLLHPDARGSRQDLGQPLE